MIQYDAIVIGTGQAGPSLAFDLAGRGQRVAVAEGHRFGGSCVNYGCRPTKTLIASAHAAHLARRAADFGVTVPSVVVDWERVRGRVRQIVDTASTGLESGLRETDGITVYHAYAAFTGHADGLYHVQVGGDLLAAPRVFINTGTRARLPDVPGADVLPPLDSESLLALDVLPDHLIIMGGSYIGLEMAQAFRRLGSQVTIIETSECLINREDDDIKAEIHRVFEREGITVHTSSRLVGVAPADGGGVCVTVRHDADNSDHAITGSHWLSAIGRVPNADRLGLETVGIERDPRGFITVNPFLETTAPGVYALGDVNGKGAFTHTAYQDYEIVRDNLLHQRQRQWTQRGVAYALYTDPPLGRVGLSEREARASGRRVLRALTPLSRVGRAVEEAQTDGLIKLLVDADTHQIIGAAVLGLHGDEAIHAIGYFMATGAGYHVLRDALPIHPTVAEFFPSMLGALEPLS